ncbi:MAG: DeoR/GlpR family DNA-binding transcription regulator [Planctomycetota bacterium]|nr:DeoR/GlpR transcriptional regulator [Planctomycetaceae bacterium]MDQ3333264.1 DeoR/GlpR family DNA-binding transcription regulator [Planctomycetota bacterium]
MLLDQRRQQILKAIEEKGFISLHELAGRFPASESTLRRDLEYLDRIGQVRRTRGGAAYVGDSLTAFEDRTVEAAPQKRRIAAAVAELIQPYETILLDGGTTTFEVARSLAGKPLQVVTNSLPIASLLVNRPEVELIFVGGYLYPKTGVALGTVAVAALAGMRVRRLVMSVGGLTEAGLFNTNSLLVETERQMIETAEEVIVASDSGKLGRPALARIAPLNVADHVVTDDGVTESWKNIFAREDIQLTVA